MTYFADQVLKDGKLVGVSSGRTYSLYCLFLPDWHRVAHCEWPDKPSIPGPKCEPVSVCIRSRNLRFERPGQAEALAKGVTPRPLPASEGGASLGRGLAHRYYSPGFSPVPTAFTASPMAGA
jgi:hypothetical protein